MANKMDFRSFQAAGIFSECPSYEVFAEEDIWNPCAFLYVVQILPSWKAKAESI